MKEFYAIFTGVAWFRVVCGLVIGTGLLCAGAAHPATAQPWELAMDIVHWPLDDNPGTFVFSTRASSAMLGGVMAGWGAAMFSLPLSDTTRRPMLVGVLSWFAVDSVASIAAGFTGNVGLNVVFLLLFLPPLLGPPRAASRA